MSIRALDHVNIRTEQLDATIAFYRDVLGMKVSAPPGAKPDTRAAWVLDEAGNAVVHIGDACAVYPTDEHAPFVPSKGGGSVHHIAFSCQDCPAVRERLSHFGIRATENHIPQIGLQQLFIHDPNGIFLELNFWGTEERMRAPKSSSVSV